MKKGVADKVSLLLIRAIQLIFVLCIGFVFSQVMFNNTIYKYDVTIVVRVMLLMILFFGILWFVLRKYEITDARINLITAIFLACFGIVQMTVASKLEFNPVFDMGSVYHGAIEWLEKGTVKTYEEYFYYFPNNLGLTIIFRFLFSIAKMIGYTNYFMVGSFAGCISTLVMMWAIIQICRKLVGNKCALLAIVLMAVIPPFYLMAGAFYTDVMSLAVIPLIIYFYLRAEEQDKIKKKVLWYVLIAVVSAFGMKIKFTVVIGLIALFIITAIKGKWKEIVILAVSVGVITSVVYGAFHAVVYPKLLNEETAEQMNTPYLHWIMMGLQGKGSYNHGDYEFTRSYKDLDERQDALMLQIKARIKENGAGGMVKLYQKKTINCFGDGTFAMSDFLDDSPVNLSKFHDKVLYSGSQYKEYSSICQGVFVFIMLCMLVYGAKSFFFDEYDVAIMTDEDKKKIANKAIFMLAFIGIWLFLMLWETSGRYMLNHISMMIICAVFGIEGLCGGMCHLKDKMIKKANLEDIKEKKEM